MKKNYLKPLCKTVPIGVQKPLCENPDPYSLFQRIFGNILDIFQLSSPPCKNNV